MNMRKVSSLIVAIGLLVACREVETPDAEHDWKEAVRRGEAEFQEALRRTVETASEANEIVLYHVANPFDEDYAQVAGREKAHHYPIRNQTRLERENAEALLALLTNRKTYFKPGDGWTCIFEPRHVLRIASNAGTAVLVICVKCGDVEFIVNGKSIGTRSVLPGANHELARIIDGLLKTLVNAS